VPIIKPAIPIAHARRCNSVNRRMAWGDLHVVAVRTLNAKGRVLSLTEEVLMQAVPIGLKVDAKEPDGMLKKSLQSLKPAIAAIKRRQWGNGHALAYASDRVTE
jgi:hypothetical protein